MKLPLPVLVLALIAALISSSLSARPGFPGGSGHEGPLNLLDRVAEQIGLTVAQEDAINQLVNEAKLSSAVDRERMGQIREELQRLSRSDGSFDSSAASVLAEELAGIVERTTLSGAETRWNMRQILTPEQREQLDQLRSGRWQSHSRFDGTDPLAE